MSLNLRKRLRMLLENARRRKHRRRTDPESFWNTMRSLEDSSGEVGLEHLTSSERRQLAQVRVDWDSLGAEVLEQQMPRDIETTQNLETASNGLLWLAAGLAVAAAAASLCALASSLPPRKPSPSWSN